MQADVESILYSGRGLYDDRHMVSYARLNASQD
jgi:hypothetical protein